MEEFLHYKLIINKLITIYELKEELIIQLNSFDFVESLIIDENEDFELSLLLILNSLTEIEFNKVESSLNNLEEILNHYLLDSSYIEKNQENDINKRSNQKINKSRNNATKSLISNPQIYNEIDIKNLLGNNIINDNKSIKESNKFTNNNNNKDEFKIQKKFFKVQEQLFRNLLKNTIYFKYLNMTIEELNNNYQNKSYPEQYFILNRIRYLKINNNYQNIKIKADITREEFYNKLNKQMHYQRLSVMQETLKKSDELQNYFLYYIFKDNKEYKTKNLENQRLFEEIKRQYDLIDEISISKENYYLQLTNLNEITKYLKIYYHDQDLEIEELVDENYPIDLKKDIETLINYQKEEEQLSDSIRKLTEQKNKLTNEINKYDKLIFEGDINNDFVKQSLYKIEKIFKTEFSNHDVRNIYTNFYNIKLQELKNNYLNEIIKARSDLDFYNNYSHNILLKNNKNKVKNIYFDSKLLKYGYIKSYNTKNIKAKEIKDANIDYHTFMDICNNNIASLKKKTKEYKTLKNNLISHEQKAEIINKAGFDYFDINYDLLNDLLDMYSKRSYELFNKYDINNQAETINREFISSLYKYFIDYDPINSNNKYDNQLKNEIILVLKDTNIIEDINTFIKNNSKTKQRYYTSNDINLFEAEISKKNQKDIIEIFKNNNSITSNYYYQFPEYSSRHFISQPKSYLIKKEDKEIHYIPYLDNNNINFQYKINKTDLKNLLNKYFKNHLSNVSINTLVKELEEINIKQNSIYELKQELSQVISRICHENQINISVMNRRVFMTDALYYYKQTEKEQHHQIISEQGKLYFKNFDKQELSTELQNLNLVNSEIENIPIELTKFNNYHPEYLQGEKLNINLQTNIIHGLTGTNNFKDTIKRLENIIESGGLKSTALRRKEAIKTQSMSPLGDIASGIDNSVPAKIGIKPSYGNYIFFLLKPDCIYKNHIFFAPTDFGAGESRYEAYNKYAKELGLKNIHTPPNLTQRQTHLDKCKITGSSEKSELNEIWIKDEIGFNEINAIVLYSDIKQEKIEFEKLIKYYKETNKLPKDLKIIYKTNNMDLSKENLELNAQYYNIEDLI